MFAELLQILFDLWKFDIEIFSKPWLYWWLLVPAIFYLSFFVLKWAVITAPLWLPVVIIVAVCKRL